jgi:hypothetical protein
MNNLDVLICTSILVYTLISVWVFVKFYNHDDEYDRSLITTPVRLKRGLFVMLFWSPLILLGCVWILKNKEED